MRTIEESKRHLKTMHRLEQFDLWVIRLAIAGLVAWAACKLAGWA